MIDRTDFRPPRALRFLGGGLLLSLLSAVAWKGQALEDARLRLGSHALLPGEELLVEVDGEPGALPILRTYDAEDDDRERPTAEVTLPPVPLSGHLSTSIDPAALPPVESRVEVLLVDAESGRSLSRSNVESLRILRLGSRPERGRVFLRYRGEQEAFVEVLVPGTDPSEPALWSGFLFPGDAFGLDLPADSPRARLLVDGVPHGEVGGGSVPGAAFERLEPGV